MADLNTFVEKTLKLLNLEKQAEINESKAFYENADCTELENKGVCLRKLVVLGQRTGLYGRILLTLGKAKEHTLKNLPLPANCITTGDIVGLSYSSVDSNVAELSSGIVTRVSETLIVIAFEESFDSPSIDADKLMRITRLANDVTFKRMKRALEALCVPSSFCSSRLISVIFGDTEIGEPLNFANLQGKQGGSTIRQEVFFNDNLNQSQRDAVKFALTCRDVGIIHGPPGTGKTTTIVEVIVQAVKNCDLKILACAPSNVAVDNILERLTKYKIKAVRLGHPARVMEKIHSYSLDAILDSSHETAIVKDVRRDIDLVLRTLQGNRNPGERARLRTEIKTLRKELREREEKALKQVLQNAEVILSTNVSASDDGPLKHLPKDHFDLVIIDEAAQSLEAACWIPLLRAPRCILAGDHKQLPPTIMSRDAARRGLEQTLMERIIKMLGDKVVHMLTTQYRMNEMIMRWSSQRLYDGKLLADVSVAQHLLRHLSDVRDTELTSLPLLMIDTAGCDLYELPAQDEESKGNEGEADVVAAHIEGLVASGVKQQDIGVITPYNLQVELLRSRLSCKYPALEIKSMDGFQGREKEAIIISMVRSNTKGEIGFLAENRRMNVAVTRARRHLTIVGDSSTVSRDLFLSSLVEYISAHGEIWSAEQYRCHISGENTHLARRITTKVSREDKSDRKDSKQSKERNNANTQSKKKHEKSTKMETGSFRYSNSKSCRDNPLVSIGQKDTTEDNTEELERQIKALLNDPTRLELVFSTDLSSRDRFTVHRLAEELGLEHSSKGTGEERYIAVAKKPTSDYDKTETDRATTKSDCRTEFIETEPSDNMNICQSCGKQIPLSNMSLHDLRCKQDAQLAPEKNTGNIIVRSVGSGKQSKKNGGGTKRNENTAIITVLSGKKAEKLSEEKVENMENLDDLLAEFRRKDSQCALDDCKKSVLTVGQKCRYCSNVYCLGHRFPEVHGCTQAAKDHERGATAAPRQVSQKAAGQRGHLERKLESKIKGMQGKRKIKQKDGK